MGGGYKLGLFSSNSRLRYKPMKKERFNIGHISIKVKNLFYGLLTVSVICGIIISITNVIKFHSDIFTILTAFIINTLCIIGIIAVILEVAKKWSYVAGLIMAAFALFIMFSLPEAYNFEHGVFYRSAVMIALQYIASSAWLICGVLLIINRNILKKDEVVSS